MRLLAALYMLVAACGRDPQPAPEASPSSKPVELDPRDQYQLARDIDGALGADLEEDGPILARTVRSWTGQRIGWELRYVPVLCKSHAACNLAPFDHNRPDKPIAQGWLPQLELSPKAHADLARRCAGIERCIVRVEARIKTLVVSPEDPTSVVLDDVSIGDAREQRADESWIVSRRPTAQARSRM
jgi:hypothetical protein